MALANMTVLITLTTAGADSGPFRLYSDVDGYATYFEVGVSKASLLAGYTSTVVPASTTSIRVVSIGVCTNSIDIPVTTTTTTSTTTSFVPGGTTIELGYSSVDRPTACINAGLTGDNFVINSTFWISATQLFDSTGLNPAASHYYSDGSKSRLWNGTAFIGPTVACEFQ